MLLISELAFESLPNQYEDQYVNVPISLRSYAVRYNSRVPDECPSRILSKWTSIARTLPSTRSLVYRFRYRLLWQDHCRIRSTFTGPTKRCRAHICLCPSTSCPSKHTFNNRLLAWCIRNSLFVSRLSLSKSTLVFPTAGLFSSPWKSRFLVRMIEPHLVGVECDLDMSYNFWYSPSAW
jgi:hypothetical protein